MDQSDDLSNNKALEKAVGKLLDKKGLSIALAESCTGGRIAAKMTRIPGCSRYFESACVTYSNRSKVRLLSVSSMLLKEKGAVSPEVAIAMAEGIRKKEGVDLGLAVTGIAGPDGGSLERPIGLVYIALSDGHQKSVTDFHFHGNREAIQSSATRMALEVLYRHLSASMSA